MMVKHKIVVRIALNADHVSSLFYGEKEYVIRTKTKTHGREPTWLIGNPVSR